MEQNDLLLMEKLSEGQLNADSVEIRSFLKKVVESEGDRALQMKAIRLLCQDESYLKKPEFQEWLKDTSMKKLESEDFIVGRSIIRQVSDQEWLGNNLPVVKKASPLMFSGMVEAIKDEAILTEEIARATREFSIDRERLAWQLHRLTNSGDLIKKQPKPQSRFEERGLFLPSLV